MLDTVVSPGILCFDLFICHFRKDRVTGTREKYWPIADWRVLSNDPRSLSESYLAKFSPHF